uniref:Metallo-beta-lactamase domain-containing protein n=1 Tax=Rhodosorus marinus TaxID=101924 RepID=A0A7S3AAR3_9RHOD
MAEPVKVYPPGGGGDILEVIPLGAGSEVGRSCCLVKYRGKSVLFDCGVHPAYSGLASLPFFDAIDADEIDLALITHFHLDHCAGLPYLLERTNFNPKARIFMTHPTKAIYKALLSDFVRVSSHSTSSEENLYNEQDILKTMERIESLDYHQEMTVNGIRFWAYNAGHVLGAAMFMIEIAGVRVLYTGDFSRQEDRHLKEAEIPPYKPDVLIVER